MDLHGKYDINFGDLANGLFAGCALSFFSPGVTRYKEKADV